MGSRIFFFSYIILRPVFFFILRLDFVLTSAASSSSELVSLPQGVRLNIFNMLSPEDKMTISTVCKNMHRDCHLPHGLLQPPIDPICMFSSDKNNIDNDHRGIRLLQQLGHQQEHDARKKKTLQNHYRIEIKNLHQFGTVGASLQDLFTLSRGAQMTGVTELDVSVATQQTVWVSPDFLGSLSLMVPNLRALNLTNIGIDYNSSHVLSNFASFCPNLEKIIWNNGRNYTGSITVREDYIDAKGDVLEPVQKLKEIECNNRCFLFWGDLLAEADDPNKFLFHKCSKNFERVSIKNASAIGVAQRRGTTTGIPQAVLVKFVRKVPSLRYFSSDLTPDNITMLQLERPDILFE